MNIDAGRLAQIQEQVKRKDVAAHMLGVALVEFERHKQRQIEIIEKADQTQQRIGDAALAAIGLSDSRRHFRIDQETGAVTELVAGAYVEIKG